MRMGSVARRHLEAALKLDPGTRRQRRCSVRYAKPGDGRTSHVIGIDLGTTNSVVAIVQGGQPHVIPNCTGQNLTPSIVAITNAGKRLVGQLAKRQAITNPENTVRRQAAIGRKFSSDQVRRARGRSYRIVVGEHDDVRVQMGEKAVSLPEICGGAA